MVREENAAFTEELTDLSNIFVSIQLCIIFLFQSNYVLYFNSIFFFFTDFCMCFGWYELINYGKICATCHHNFFLTA